MWCWCATEISSGAAAPTIAAAEGRAGRASCAVERSAADFRWGNLFVLEEKCAAFERSAIPASERLGLRTAWRARRTNWTPAIRLPTSRTHRLSPEPRLAQWTDGKLTVWMGTQRPFAVRDDLADIFHVPEKNVRVIVPDTGSALRRKNIPATRVWKRHVWQRRAGGAFREAGLDARGGIHLGRISGQRE